MERIKSESGDDKESSYKPKEYEMSLSDTWDTESECKLFVQTLKDLKLYGPDFRYSGFDAGDIQKNRSDKEGNGVIFCSRVEDLDLDDNGEHFDNALQHALNYDNPVVGVYDVNKLGHHKGHPSYKVMEGSALVAVVRIKA